MFLLPGWHSTCGSRHATVSPLVANPADTAGTQHQCPCLLLVELTPACPTESSVTKQGARDARAQHYKRAQLSSVQSSHSGPSDSL